MKIPPILQKIWHTSEEYIELRKYKEDMKNTKIEKKK